MTSASYFLEANTRVKIANFEELQPSPFNHLPRVTQHRRNPLSPATIVLTGCLTAYDTIAIRDSAVSWKHPAEVRIPFDGILLTTPKSFLNQSPATPRPSQWQNSRRRHTTMLRLRETGAIQILITRTVRMYVCESSFCPPRSSHDRVPETEDLY